MGETRRVMTEDVVNAILFCPLCDKRTQHRKGTREGIAKAALIDGTCEPCWRRKLGHNHRHANGSPPPRETDVDAWRGHLEAYMKDRRARGVDPAGNADLDEEFKNDLTWQRTERDRLKKKAEAREQENLRKVSRAGREPVPALRDDGDAGPAASAQPWHGRFSQTPRTV